MRKARFKTLSFIESNKHLYTLNYSEGTGTGFTFQTVAFTAFLSADDADMIPLYRCYKASHNDCFVSLDPNCEGQAHEGSFGYVSSGPRVGFTALYRFYSSGSRDHLITKIASEGNGWTPEGILGYVPL
jgi:hypothetical protein